MARAADNVSHPRTASLSRLPTLTEDRIGELTRRSGAALPSDDEFAELARIWGVSEAFLRYGYDEDLAGRLTNSERGIQVARAILDLALQGEGPEAALAALG